MDIKKKLQPPLQGKLAIVTGASRGLGASMAWELASRGADICLTYVSDSSSKAVDELRQKIHSLPHQPTTFACQADFSRIDGPQEIVSSLRDAVRSSRCREKGGDGRQGCDLVIDILVNNAGVERGAMLADVTVADYDFIYNTNVRGLVLMTQAVLPFLRPGTGRIINLSSVGARHGFTSGMGLYSSAKAAVEGFTRSWAAELGGRGITVNAVAPGPVQSDMLDKIPPEVKDAQKRDTPLQNRLGTAEEIAAVVAWLAGEDSGWVTGQVISASGGWAMY